MKFYFLLIFAFLLTACLDTPEIPTAKKVQAKEKIENNKYTAIKEQETYLKLQRKRQND
jgi:outer membrane biogenesis lipoprotein LolB